MLEGSVCLGQGKVCLKLVIGSVGRTAMGLDIFSDCRWLFKMQVDA